MNKLTLISEYQRNQRQKFFFLKHSSTPMKWQASRLPPVKHPEGDPGFTGVLCGTYNAFRVAGEAHFGQNNENQ